MVDKNLNKYFNEKSNVPFVVDMLNLGNDSTDLIKVDKHENKNLLKDVFEIDNQYKLIKDKDIIDSFQKVFHDYKVVYKSKKILNSTFNYIEICIKDQNNKPVNMKDLFQISVYIS